ncbi:MAG: alpha-glucan family phosphorylase, partial [Candidatus Peregrinibacteria bacterium]|nr:alpha-glucan family phosphorylase [Candidatus Peregrinibacteria bacterium]
NDTWCGYDFIHITNGIYLPRWINEDIRKVWSLEQKEAPSKLKFWKAHGKAKKKLLDKVEELTGSKLDEDVLTVCWARRITEYKRPTAFAHDFERLKKILNDKKKPVQILIAGKTHRQDEKGREFIKEINKLCKQEARLVFVPNFNIELAKLMVAGSDVWLNTPMQGHEACGTSGMKACLNGCLQLSIEDGWVAEVRWENLGWLLDNDNVSNDIYNFLEGYISDMYYDRDEKGIPQEWVDRMIKSSDLIRRKFSSRKMLKKYYDELYV